MTTERTEWGLGETKARTTWYIGPPELILPVTTKILTVPIILEDQSHMSILWRLLKRKFYATISSCMAYNVPKLEIVFLSCI